MCGGLRERGCVFFEGVGGGVREHARETCLSVCVHLSVYARAPHLLNDKLALSAFARRRRTCGIIVAVGAEHACVCRSQFSRACGPGKKGSTGSATHATCAHSRHACLR